MPRRAFFLLMTTAALGCAAPCPPDGGGAGYNSASGPAPRLAAAAAGEPAAPSDDWSAQGPASSSGSGLLTADLPDDGRVLFDGDRSRGGATAVAYSQSGNARKWRQLKGQLAQTQPPRAIYGSIPAPDGSLKPGAGVPDIPAGGAVALSEYERFEQSMFTTVYPVLTRLGWHAHPRRGSAQGITPYRITVHHTQGHMSHGEAETAREVRGIQEFHMGPERGWNDIGYHFLIDGDGRVAEGRPTNVLGAHAGGANAGNIGISLMGNFDVEQPAPAQIDSLERLAAYLAMKYDIPVLRPGYLEGHYHHTETDCPGRYLKVRLAELRAKINQEEASMEQRGRPAASTELASFTPLVVSRPS